MYYIGLDVHKRKISYYVKDGGGQIHAQGSISATRVDLRLERRKGEGSTKYYDMEDE
jgi:hypothetical protein